MEKIGIIKKITFNQNRYMFWNVEKNNFFFLKISRKFSRKCLQYKSLFSMKRSARDEFLKIFLTYLKQNYQNILQNTSEQRPRLKL